MTKFRAISASIENPSGSIAKSCLSLLQIHHASLMMEQPEAHLEVSTNTTTLGQPRAIKEDTTSHSPRQAGDAIETSCIKNITEGLGDFVNQ